MDCECSPGCHCECDEWCEDCTCNRPPESEPIERRTVKPRALQHKRESVKHAVKKYGKGR